MTEIVRLMTENARSLADALTEARAEAAKLREENELLRTQLEYWKEREDADPLPFAEEASDEPEQS